MISRCRGGSSRSPSVQTSCRPPLRRKRHPQSESRCSRSRRFTHESVHRSVSRKFLRRGRVGRRRAFGPGPLRGARRYACRSLPNGRICRSTSFSLDTCSISREPNPSGSARRSRSSVQPCDGRSHDRAAHTNGAAPIGRQRQPLSRESRVRLLFRAAAERQDVGRTEGRESVSPKRQSCKPAEVARRLTHTLPFSRASPGRRRCHSRHCRSSYRYENSGIHSRRCVREG